MNDKRLEFFFVLSTVATPDINNLALMWQISFWMYKLLLTEFGKQVSTRQAQCPTPN